MFEAATALARHANDVRSATRVLSRRVLWSGALSLALFAPAAAQEETNATPNPPSGDAWLMYKGDLQRTAGRETTLSAPLNLLWRHSTDGEPQANYGSPLVAGPPGQKRVYFDVGNTIYCVNAQTGAQVWRSNPLATSLAAPMTFMATEGGDFLLAGSYSGRLYALRASDGVIVWQAEAGSALANTAPTLIGTARGDRIILGTSHGRIIAFTREGQRDPAWDIQLGRFGSSPTTSIVVSPDGTRLFVAAQDSKIYVLDVNARNVFFVLPLSGRTRSTPLILRDTLVVAAGTQVLAYRESTGAPLWRQDVPHTMISSPAAIIEANGAASAFIGTSRGLFVAFDLQSGSKKWELDLESSVTGTPLALPDMIIVGTSNGILYGLDPATGNRKWQYRMNTQRVARAGARPTTSTSSSSSSSDNANQIYGISSVPSISGDQLFVLADNAALYAFDTRSFDATPPRAIAPTLSILTVEKRLQSNLIGRGRPVPIPGIGPIYFAIELEDVGSGVDAESLRITLNDREISGEDVIYQPARSVLSARLLRTGAQNLPDGTYTVAMSAADYQGNTMSYTGTFMVDNSLRPPTAPPPLTPPPLDPQAPAEPVVIEPAAPQPEENQPEENQPENEG